MARTARCPSCGAPVEFKSVASILAVCSYCQSTLVRDGQELANLGRMADLIEDRSPLQIGAEGRWKGTHFALIGRIQLRWEQGMWNEWHLLFDDGKSGWLSESGGEYVISMPAGRPQTPPPFSALQLGQRVWILGKGYDVTNILMATCVAGQGELPFKVGAGYPAPVADLRDETGGFATLDYSDDPAKPLVFVGESVEFKSLGWNNLRQGMPIPEPTVKARAFNCPSCAAPLSIRHENIKCVGCPSCGAVLDTANETIQLLGQASLALKVEPLLPLGARGKLRGEDVEVVGFMRRGMTVDNVKYRWSEYVLLGRDARLLWLTEYLGHWNLAWVLPRVPAAAVGSFVVDKEEFKHFQTYDAYVDYVVGEFPWRVQIDETAKVQDYVAPPRMLSRESTQSEVTFTLAEYLAQDELQQAFKLPARLPAAKGIFANQPNPYEQSNAKLWHRFWMFLVLALLVHAGLSMRSSGMLLNESLEFTRGNDNPQLTREFQLAAAVPRLEVELRTNIDNDWVDLDLTLVNKNTGEAWEASRGMSHYQGFEQGVDEDGKWTEYWSEGSQTDSVTFAALPAGRYVLSGEADLGPTTRTLRAQLQVFPSKPRWSSLLLLLAALMLFPVYTLMRYRGFETARWADSDHPVVTSRDDDSDSDSED
jgi:hypothetical protein